ncbi:DUF1850 domain-containing protein [Halobacteriaceae archaeon GCM10025711]
MSDHRRAVRGAGLVAALLIIVASVAVAANVPVGRTLVVEDAETGERLLSQPVENGTLVALEYNHSVEKTRVYDVYAVQDDTLVMTSMEFESYGWGLPARQEVRLEDGKFVFDPEWQGEELYVKPGRVAGHRLYVGNETYDLVSLSDARSVRLHVARRSALSAALDEINP